MIEFISFPRSLVHEISYIKIKPNIFGLVRFSVISTFVNLFFIFPVINILFLTCRLSLERWLFLGKQAMYNLKTQQHSLILFFFLKSLKQKLNGMHCL